MLCPVPVIHRLCLAHLLLELSFMLRILYPALLLMYFLTGLSLPIGILHLNTSMFLVYATLFPDAEFRIWFTIPIKGKWLAMAEMAFLVFSIFRSDNIHTGSAPS